MRKDKPTIAIKFNIDKIEAAAYGYRCWLEFWKSVSIEDICYSKFFVGDSQATLDGKENAFYIVVQTFNKNAIENIKKGLKKSKTINDILFDKLWYEKKDVLNEPLIDCGEIDSRGKLIGEADFSRIALGTILRERGIIQNTTFVKQNVPPRNKPFSKCTDNLPNISSIIDLEDLFFQKYGNEDNSRYYVSPEELSDIAEYYEKDIQVQWYECAESWSLDTSFIKIFKKGCSGKNISLRGLFMFPSLRDLCSYRLIEENNHSLSELKCLYGLKGALVTKYISAIGNDVDENDYKKENDVEAYDLWPLMFTRRKELEKRVEKSDIDELETNIEEEIQYNQNDRCESDNDNAFTVGNPKKWWKFWE